MLKFIVGLSLDCLCALLATSMLYFTYTYFIKGEIFISCWFAIMFAHVLYEYLTLNFYNIGDKE